jgi:hypothetical protein
MNDDIRVAVGVTVMDYYATMILILIALALVMLFLLLHLRLFRTAFAFGLAVLVSLFFFMQHHPRKVIAIEDVPMKQRPAKTCGAG